MGASTALRLGFGMLTFVAMARVLGPESFGVVMLWMSVATLAALVTNYGFTPYLLREIGANPERSSLLMGEVLTAKLILIVAVALAAFCAVFWISVTSALIFYSLLVALMADSMTEFLNVSFRATNRFSTETRIASFSALAQFLIVACSLWLVPTASAAAVSFAFSRLFVMLVTWVCCRSVFGPIACAPTVAGWRRLKSASLFATDLGVQNLFGQIDSVVLSHSVGAIGVGLFQAGFRLFAAGAQSATVLGNVLIPYLASLGRDDATSVKGARKLVAVFAATGAIGGLVFAVIPSQLVVIVFGSSYGDLSGLLGLFGLLFFVRFVAAGFGTVLSVARQQLWRVAVSVVHWCVVFLAAYISGLGAVDDWLRALVVGNVCLFVMYGLLCARRSLV